MKTFRDSQSPSPPRSLSCCPSRIPATQPSPAQPTTSSAADPHLLGTRAQPLCCGSGSRGGRNLKPPQTSPRRRLSARPRLSHCARLPDLPARAWRRLLHSHRVFALQIAPRAPSEPHLHHHPPTQIRRFDRRTITAPGLFARETPASPNPYSP